MQAGIQHQAAYWNFTYRSLVIKAERSLKNWANPGNYFKKSIYNIYYLGGRWLSIKDLLTQRRKRTHEQSSERSVGVGSENNWILMRICRMCENEFKVMLESKWPPGCSQGGCSDPWKPCFISYLRRDVSLLPSLGCSLLLGWLKMQPGHPCTRMHTHVRASVPRRRGRIQTGLHTARISDWHHGYHWTREDIGLISPTRNRVLASKVGVCPRVRCASSEGGSGCCRASTLHTAPVKTDRRDTGS